MVDSMVAPMADQKAVQTVAHSAVRMAVLTVALMVFQLDVSPVVRWAAR